MNSIASTYPTGGTQWKSVRKIYDIVYADHLFTKVKALIRYLDKTEEIRINIQVPLMIEKIIEKRILPEETNRKSKYAIKNSISILQGPKFCIRSEERDDSIKTNLLPMIQLVYKQQNNTRMIHVSVCIY